MLHFYYPRSPLFADTGYARLFENLLSDLKYMNYRADIDALRTFAVIAVVIFHFNGMALPGGFAGVDVFFAISGYLMTGIIVSGLESNSFSTFRFYLSRAKRILPALSVLCLSLMVFGWLNLPPRDYSELSKHALSSVFFVSNFVYWQEAGYFDTASHEKWLLHTWSLSAEWQFYLIYPILLIALFKLTKGKGLRLSIISLAVFSYAYGVVSSYIWPTASYFLLPGRAWEMLAGGLAYLYVMKGNSILSRYFHYSGILIIVASYFFVSSQDMWPGYMALMPVIGSCMYLCANYQSIISKFKPVIFIGKWSYSIYLWHWPIVVYCYVNGIDINIFTGIAMSILFGFVSYQLIEKRRVIKLLAISPVAIAASAYVMVNNGFAYQIPKEIYNSAMLDPNSPEFGDYTWKKIKEFNSDFTDNGRKILVIGDSTAGDFINMMIESKVDDRAQIRARITNAKCGTFFLTQEQRNKLYMVSDDVKTGLVKKETCDNDGNKLYNDSIITKADVIVVSMNWRAWALPELRESLENLRKVTAAPIFVVGSKSFQDTLPKIIYEAYSDKKDIGKLAYLKSNDQIKINNIARNMSLSVSGVSFIDLKSSMCDNIKKECIVFYDKLPLLYDGTHSTVQGVKYLSRKIAGQMSEIR